MNSGIYIIQSKESKNFYVGQSMDVQRREYEHRSTLRRGVHGSPILQNAFDKYGEDGLEFRVLMYLPVDELDRWEQWCLDNWQPEYNIATDVCASRRGAKLTLEQRQQLSDAHQHQRGEQSGHNKLTEKDVIEIRSRLEDGETCGGISKDYPVSDSQIRSIRHGGSWSHLGPLATPKILGERVGTSKLTSEDVLTIRRRASAGETQIQIAEDYPVGSPTINMIVNRKRWRHI